MKAQELPISTMAIAGLGLIFFVVLLMIFGNIGGLGEAFGVIGSGGDNPTNCQNLCNQAQNFEAGTDVTELAFCQNNCVTPCTIYDSEGNIHMLHEECYAEA